MSVTCPTAEKAKYEVSFYFKNKEFPGVDPIELVRYSMGVPFPGDFKKGDKFYISQSDMSPRVEGIIRDRVKTEIVGDRVYTFSDEFVNKFLQEKRDFTQVHWIHEVKINKVHKGLKNEWDYDGKNVLVYSVEYQLKECFYISMPYFKRIILKKFKKLIGK
jgi:hypothetical protein